MSRKPELISRLVDLYRDLTSRPTPIAGRILNKPKSPHWSSYQLVSTTWSQRNLERGQLTSFGSTYEVHLKEKDVRIVATGDTSQELLSRLSQSERLRCVVRQVLDGTKKKQFLEIWEEGRLWRNFDLAAIDLHGDIYADDEFGSLQWAPNEKHVVYIAEKKKPKTEPFYKQTAPKKDKAASGDDQPLKGEEFTYVEEWGEQMIGKSQPVIAVCDVDEGALRLLDGVPEQYCPGQLIWNGEGDGIFGIGVESLPRRLGLIYCTNRPGVVFHLSLSGEFSVLSEVGQSPRSCRLSPDGRTLVWLQRPAGGPHDGCQALLKIDTVSKEVKTIVGIVDTATGDGDRPFFGIYGGRLPTRCFSADSALLVFDTIRKYSQVMYSVKLETGELSELGEGRVLDVWGNNLLVVNSSPTEPPYLQMLGIVDQLSDSIKITPSCRILQEAVLHKIDLESDYKPGASAWGGLNCMLFKPESTGAERSVPLIVLPHGGPHIALIETFMLEPAFYVSLGFAVLLVNYRGSTGYGQACVDSVLGHVGDVDVKDVDLALEHVLKTYSDLNPDKVVAYGGSHGGFLSLHLAGQYPDKYKAVAVRNPVVDLPPMFVTSDIPDWVSVESGSEYPAGSDPSATERDQMATMSPMRLVANVKAPTLLLVGSADIRVPPSQAIHYYRTLKARGVKTKMHIYNDCHPLSTVPVHLDALINSTLWFLDSVDHTI